MVAAAEQAGKQVILCVGPVKAFGYPEFFVPSHRLAAPLPEGALIGPSGYPDLLAAGAGFARRVVRRYRARRCVIAWQVEHEAVDPLGTEHSWRLSADFARAEVEAVRAADPDRPVLMNGFLPTSLPVAASQWWRTRDQGDSLTVARRLADIVGIDFYPRHALIAAAGRSLYLDGSRSPWQQQRPGRTVGGGHHPAQPGRPGHVQLPARAPDRDLQPVPELGAAAGQCLAAGRRAVGLPVLGRRVLAAAGPAGRPALPGGIPPGAAGG
jgi:hypothetical protein